VSLSLPVPGLRLSERHGALPEGGLFHGDNLLGMELLGDRKAGLVYIDPPFAAGSDFSARLRVGGDKLGVKAYSDRWDGMEGYLAMLRPRLERIHGLLSETGSVFVHCDWRAVHRIRCILDDVFGADHFQNEICWAYGRTARGAKAVARQFARNHDSILWYRRGARAAFYGDTSRRLLTGKEARATGYRQDGEGRWFKTAPRGDYTDRSIARLDAEGRIHVTRNGKVRIKYFLPTDSKGRVVEESAVGDVWTDIPDAMHLPRREKLGYATQKPEALLARIIGATTRPGELVADFFCGSGTALAVAHRMGRQWIGGDLGGLAFHMARARLLRQGASFSCWREGEDAPLPCGGIGFEAQSGGLRITGFEAPSERLRGYAWEDQLDGWMLGRESGGCYQSLWSSYTGGAVSPPLEGPLELRAFDILGKGVSAALPG
jgi:adenine-specific DNA-methyltransferase